jgi:Protein of unknown function (DUF1826)
MIAYRLAQATPSLPKPHLTVQEQAPKPLANHTISDFNPLEALEIFEHGRQIKVINRPINEEISKYLVSANLRYGAKFILPVGQSFSSKLLASHALPKHAGRDAFLADLDHLSELYADLMDCAQIGIRLEVLSGAMCPKFHVDRTGIRMLCTYQGQGTEWLEDAYANRAKLGMSAGNLSDNESGLILDTKGIHQVPQFAIALLKGSAWQGNHMHGIIHRSPPVLDDKPRVLVAMDAIW